MNFRILALEVLKGCNTTHSKNLEKNVAYKLYSNYQISSERIVKYKEDINLYSNDLFDLYINISAIVGKNGSGKSTIVELIIKALNNFFYYYKEIHPEKKFHPVIPVKNIELNLYYQYDGEIFRLYVKDNSFKVFQYKKSNDEYVNPEEINKFDLGQLFYTEVLNYSLYAYRE